MDAKFCDPMSVAFTTKQEGATFEDARPKSLLKKIYTKVCQPFEPMPCIGWNW